MTDQPIQSETNIPLIRPIASGSSKSYFPKYVGLLFILGILLAGSGLGLLVIKNQQLTGQIEQQQAQITQLTADLNQQTLNASSAAGLFKMANEVATSSVNFLPTLSQNPSQIVSPKLSPAPSPAASSNIPAGWVTLNFPTVNLSFSVPSHWKSDIQSFPNVPSQLIRLWQGATADTATIELDIKNNWDSTGNASQIPRNFEISTSLFAAQLDPPKLSEQKLDRYQTNYYFERNSKVYILTCVHNWIPDQYQLCQQLLKTLTFSN